VVRAERADQLRVAPAAHGRDLGAERLRDLDRERPDATRRAVDEDVLTRLERAMGPDRLEGDHARHRHDGRLLEGDVRGLAGQGVLGRNRELGVGAAGAAEDGVADGEPGDARADGLHDPGHVRAADGLLGSGHPVHRPRHVGQAGHHGPVGRVDAGGMDADEHLAIPGDGRRKLAGLEDGRSPVRVLDDGLHFVFLDFTVYI
jgi:hypothetical protein